LEAILGLIFC